ncbi:MAG: M20 family metallopeptidase [Dongiaceae bacterium]
MSDIPEPVELTAELIRFNTINPPGQEENCARFVGGLLKPAGFSVTYHELSPGRMNLIASKGNPASGNGSVASRRKPICFTGHLDTVPLGSAQWSVDPLAGIVTDGKLYGRGSSDMKSGVAAMVVAALRNLKAIENGPGVVFVFTAGEETGCDGARCLAAKNLLGDAGAIVVGEPTSNQPRIGHKGVLWLNAETHGVTAHGSMPELGVNAVYRGARIISKLEEFGFNIAPHHGLGSPTLNVGRMAGGLNVNSVPDRAEIGIDVRSVPGMQHPRIVEILCSHLAPDLAELHTLLDLEPVWTAPESPWIRAASKFAMSGKATSAELGGAPYFTDASILKSAYGDVPTLILGPGEQEMAHRTDEYCWAVNIEKAVGIYGDIIRDWQLHAHTYEEAAA